MNEEHKESPEEVSVLAQRCLAHVKHRLDVELDYQNETLSVLDYFVQDVIKEEGDGEAPPPGDGRRAHLVHLLAPTIGAYFGEVLRRVFPCRWRLPSNDPNEWLLEFEHVPLRFNPIGAAAEALAEQDIESWQGAIATAPEEMEALGERLAAAPPVPDNEFFALTTRFEVLQIAEDWLRIRIAAMDPPGPEYYSTDDYNRIFE
ncbi:MAG: hypothetical protein GY854_16600 [Deltaproteobacteria bacterium]|nr:hypothetical protein [Deltaproteobacteria bacterium]